MFQLNCYYFRIFWFIFLVAVFSVFSIKGASAGSKCYKKFFIENERQRQSLRQDTHKLNKMKNAIRAAKSGDTLAQYELGILFEQGFIESPNFKKAAKYFLLAANQGSILASYKLGTYFLNGLGVKQDISQGVKYLQLAADQGCSEAQLILGDLYQWGNQEILPNYEIAYEYYLQAAERGNSHALYSLGYIFENGLGIPQDEEKALSFYRQSAQKGNTSAQYRLGMMHEEGKAGLKKNRLLATRLYFVSAQNGNSDAKNQLEALNQEEFCPICTETFGETPSKEITVTSCLHSFHHSCLDAWKKARVEIRYCKSCYSLDPNCPLCHAPCPTCRAPLLHMFEAKSILESNL